MYVELGATSPYAGLAMGTMFFALILISILGTLLGLNGMATARRRKRLERQAQETDPKQ